MATPQTENGFVMIALDLFASIMTADLPNRCMIVLSYHLIHSYGPAKDRDVFLDPHSIEDYTGLHRNNVRRAIKELCEAKIFEKRPGGVYHFNKDYEAWTPGGVGFAERLNGGAREFAAWANNAHGKRARKPKAAPTPATAPVPPDSATTVGPNPDGFNDNRKTQSNGIGTIADSTNTGVVTTSELPSTCGESLAYAGACPHKSIRFEIGDSKQQHPGDDGGEDAFPIRESLPPAEAAAASAATDPVPSIPASSPPAPVPDPGPKATTPAPSPVPVAPLTVVQPPARPNPPVRTSASLRAAQVPRKPTPPTISPPDPATVQELEDFALVTLGDRGELECFHMHVRGWLYTFSAKQIRDAIMYVATKLHEIRAGKLSTYTLKVLQEGSAKKPGTPGAGTESDPGYTPRTKEDDDYLDLIYGAGAKASKSTGRAS